MLWRTMGFLCFGSVQLERKCTNWSQLLTIHRALASVRLLFLSLKQSAEGGSTAQCNIGDNAKNVWSNFSSPNFQGLRVSYVLTLTSFALSTALSSVFKDPSLDDPDHSTSIDAHVLPVMKKHSGEYKDLQCMLSGPQTFRSVFMQNRWPSLTLLPCSITNK